MGLGLPGHSPGSADRNLVREAILKSESQLIEDAMLKDKIRLSDFECTEQQISEQVKNFLNVSYFSIFLFTYFTYEFVVIYNFH